MSIIMPTVEKYEVCDYNYKSLGWSAVAAPIVLSNLKSRTFEVVKTFDDLEEARKFIEGTDYVLRYVFKEIEPDATVH
tara:strand:+ start:997 stop:1230 length:234 start_codon:yes stop_codon:yes gene_type:complete